MQGVGELGKNQLHVFTMKNGNRQYVVGSHINRILGLNRGAIYNKYPFLTARPARLEEKRFLNRIGVLSTSNMVKVSIVPFSQIQSLIKSHYPGKRVKFIFVNTAPRKNVGGEGSSSEGEEEEESDEMEFEDAEIEEEDEEEGSISSMEQEAPLSPHYKRARSGAPGGRAVKRGHTAGRQRGRGGRRSNPAIDDRPPAKPRQRGRSLHLGHNENGVEVHLSKTGNTYTGRKRGRKPKAWGSWGSGWDDQDEEFDEQEESVTGDYMDDDASEVMSMHSEVGPSRVPSTPTGVVHLRRQSGQSRRKPAGRPPRSQASPSNRQYGTYVSDTSRASPFESDTRRSSGSRRNPNFPSPHRSPFGSLRRGLRGHASLENVEVSDEALSKVTSFSGTFPRMGTPVQVQRHCEGFVQEYARRLQQMEEELARLKNQKRKLLRFTPRPAPSTSACSSETDSAAPSSAPTDCPVPPADTDAEKPQEAGLTSKDGQVESDRSTEALSSDSFVLDPASEQPKPAADPAAAKEQSADAVSTQDSESQASDDTTSPANTSVPSITPNLQPQQQKSGQSGDTTASQIKQLVFPLMGATAVVPSPPPSVREASTEGSANGGANPPAGQPHAPFASDMGINGDTLASGTDVDGSVHAVMSQHLTSVSQYQYQDLDSYSGDENDRFLAAGISSLRKKIKEFSQCITTC